MSTVFIVEQKAVVKKMVEICKKLQFMPILELNPKYVMHQKMLIFNFFSSELSFTRIISPFQT